MSHKYVPCKQCGELWDIEAPHGHTCPTPIGDDIVALWSRIEALETRIEAVEAESRELRMRLAGRTP